jgi:hypothetical protein
MNRFQSLRLRVLALHQLPEKPGEELLFGLLLPHAIIAIEHSDADVVTLRIGIAEMVDNHGRHKRLACARNAGAEKRACRALNPRDELRGLEKPLASSLLPLIHKICLPRFVIRRRKPEEKVPVLTGYEQFNYSYSHGITLAMDPQHTLLRGIIINAHFRNALFDSLNRFMN